MAEVANQTVVDNRYRIDHRIGSGGMADVYLAEDTHLGREVALKVLHRRFAQDVEFVERFRREASAAAGLQHPNVVAVFDRGEHDGTYYIAMENLRGRTLKQVIIEDAPVDPRRAIDLTIQILQAAAFAHKRGIVHRDFKPHNVIVAPDDSVKVTDFGIARAGASEMTETGSIMGTAQYLSPEQAQGQRVDARSDLYSIGITLFELLTGRVPFNGESAVSIALKHVSEPAPGVTSLRPDLPPVLEAIVARALVKDPAGRFQTAEEFVLALDDARRAIASGHPGEHTAGFTPVGPPLPLGDFDDGRGDRRSRRGRRMKWPFIALALVALALAGIAAFMSATAAEQVTVPAVVGQSVDDATARLERRGFQVTTTERHSSKPIGYVLGSDPARGAQADKGSTVTLIVSSGPAEVKVPSVTGFGESRAQKALAKLGLDSDTQTESSTEMEKGRVIRTEPAVGATVPAGERITLIVSSGPKEVQVPGVVGLTQSAAQRQLESLGLNVSVKETTSDKPAGEVIDQSPPDGAQAKEGDTVELTVSKGPEQVDVPDVLGLGVDDARASLRDAGFEVRVVEREVTDPAEEGQVIEQRPPANSKRPKGSAVTIVVGKAPAAGSGGTTPVPPVTTTPGTP